MGQNKKLYYVVTKDTEVIDPNDGIEETTGTKVISIYDIRRDGFNHIPSFRGQRTCMLSDNSKEQVEDWMENNGYDINTETHQL